MPVPGAPATVTGSVFQPQFQPECHARAAATVTPSAAAAAAARCDSDGRVQLAKPTAAAGGWQAAGN